MKKLHYLLLSLIMLYFTVTYLQAQGSDSTGVKKDESFKVETNALDMPVFMGGYEGLMNFLQQNLGYPQDAIKQGIEGRVAVQFTVSKDGSTKDINIVRSLFPSCDAEAVRVVSIIPKWIPGKLKGKPVDAIYTLPLSFKLPKPSSVMD